MNAKVEKMVILFFFLLWFFGGLALILLFVFGSLRFPFCVLFFLVLFSRETEGKGKGKK